jgi:hypothetical protein
MALVMNLKRSLSDINDDDVQIEVKKGVVYVSFRQIVICSMPTCSRLLKPYWVNRES